VLQVKVVALPPAVKVAVEPKQTDVGPEMLTVGAPIETDSILDELVPQAFAACTDITPPFVALVTAIVLLVLAPVQPEGSVQL
jgi:hypothetical protein